MSVIQRFEKELQKDISSEGLSFASLIEDFLDEKFTLTELKDLADHIEKSFFDVKISDRGPILYLLTKINPERACVLARKDLENAYQKTRFCTGYLSQVIFSIDNVEHFIQSLSAMEVEKTLRIAYALVNNLEISDGDFRPSSIKSKGNSL